MNSVFLLLESEPASKTCFEQREVVEAVTSKSLLYLRTLRPLDQDKGPQEKQAPLNLPALPADRKEE